MKSKTHDNLYVALGPVMWTLFLVAAILLTVGVIQ